MQQIHVIWCTACNCLSSCSAVRQQVMTCVALQTHPHKQLSWWRTTKAVFPAQDSISQRSCQSRNIPGLFWRKLGQLLAASVNQGRATCGPREHFKWPTSEFSYRKLSIQQRVKTKLHNKQVVVIRPVTSLWRQEGRRDFWEGPKFFELCPMVGIISNTMFQWGEKFSRGGCAPPGYGPDCNYYLQTVSQDKSLFPQSQRSL